MTPRIATTEEWLQARLETVPPDLMEAVDSYIPDPVRETDACLVSVFVDTGLLRKGGGQILKDYVLFPLLAGTVPQWSEHLPRIAARRTRGHTPGRAVPISFASLFGHRARGLVVPAAVIHLRVE